MEQNNRFCSDLRVGHPLVIISSTLRTPLVSSFFESGRFRHFSNISMTLLFTKLPDQLHYQMQLLHYQINVLSGSIKGAKATRNNVGMYLWVRFL